VKGRYPPGVFITLADCLNPARENEFNLWYNETLVPNMDTLGFVRNAERYENVFGNEVTFRSRPKYLALYEVYHDNLKQALKEIHQREDELKSQGKWFTDMIVKTNTLYQRVGPEFRSERSGSPIQIVYCGLVGPSDMSRKAEYDKWYNERHSPDALEAGLFDVGYRYDIVDPDDPMPHQSSPCFSFYETSVDLPTLQQRLENFRNKMIEVDPLWVNLLGIYYTGLFRPMKS